MPKVIWIAKGDKTQRGQNVPGMEPENFDGW